MPRFFNIAGPCDPRDHYMLPPERRVPGIRELIDQKLYFVVHAPRQVGKTTCFRALASELTRAGRYAALHATCEVGQAAGDDVERGVTAVLESIGFAAGDLPAELRPPASEPALSAATRLLRLLEQWAEACPLPVVLFLDEIDALRNGVLVSVLRQLRAGYPSRPQRFPHALALIGLRDVRDYRARLREDAESLGTASPFNIKVRSLSIRDFTREEVFELYDQHTAETGQAFTPQAAQLAFDLTRGQPWLVNALADTLTRDLVRERTRAIEACDVEQAKEVLIERRDTHLDSLAERLREPRVRRVIEPILSGELLAADVMNDDVRFAQDLGLVRSSPAGLVIANPIYREVIPRSLTFVLEQSLSLPRASYVAPGGRLDFERVLADFQALWREHAEAFLGRAPYSEAASQLVLLAFLHKIVNGGGFVDREYAAGSGRMDLCVRWPHAQGVERFALELKVWRDARPDPLAQGLEQLAGYLARLGLERGTLVLFDARAKAPPLTERCSREERAHAGLEIAVLRL